MHQALASGPKRSPLQLLLARVYCVMRVHMHRMRRCCIKIFADPQVILFVVPLVARNCASPYATAAVFRPRIDATCWHTAASWHINMMPLEQPPTTLCIVCGGVNACHGAMAASAGQQHRLKASPLATVASSKSPICHENTPLGTRLQKPRWTGYHATCRHISAAPFLHSLSVCVHGARNPDCELNPPSVWSSALSRVGVPPSVCSIASRR